MAANTDQKARLLDLVTGVLEMTRDESRNTEEVSSVLQVIKEKKNFFEILFPKNAAVSKKTTKPVLDTIIRVDRSVRPVYPDWAKTVMHPELENTGSDEFDIANVKLWLHDGQKNGKWIKGQVIYDHLKETDTLKICLGLRDGEEIQKKGIKVFRKFFGGKAVYLWKSVVRHRSDSLHVPYLDDGGGQVVVRWNWLDSAWDGDSPAARFAS